ncbi:MAG: hypothetical protein JXB45_06175 [Candidatus Krumholzibacteriota bacterium]|nr:hypothetical protein [Candidatus Krumholzibacteriota bacterium]
MQVKCSLCGGDNEIYPGQKMLFCSFCGSSLAIEKGGGPEHLILPHKRNDKVARYALQSFLTGKKLARPRDIKVEFVYLPYLLCPDEQGRVRAYPAPGITYRTGPLPFPPAGNYCFFDESLAGEEKIISFDNITAETEKVLHLPVYRLNYTAAGRDWQALVLGESLYIQAEELPPPRPSPLSVPNILAALSLLLIYLLAGKLDHGWVGRCLVIGAAASLGFAAYSVRERIAHGRK